MSKEKKVEKKINDGVKKSINIKIKARKNYYEAIIIFCCSVFILLSSSLFLYNSYFKYYPPASFIVLNEDSRVLEDTPLTEPYLPDAELSNLVNGWLQDIFDYHYLNIDTHGSKIRDYFATDIAYADFMEAFNGLRLQQRVRALNAIVMPKIIEPLSIADTSIYANTRRIYQLEGIYLAEIRSSEGLEVQRYSIRIIVSRRSLTERPSGYGIEAISIR